jgi:diguanylate cyclase (GGDEF)-like protein
MPALAGARAEKKEYQKNMVEQRTDARWALNLPALFLTRAWGRQPGLVKDFCGGGALLGFLEHEAGGRMMPKRGDGLAIQLRLNGEGKPGNIRELRCHVAHVGRNMVGVSFANPTEETLEALVHMAAAPRLSLPVGEPVRRILQVLYAQAAHYYQRSFTEFEKVAELRLLEAIGATRSLSEQRVLNDGLKAFRSHQHMVRQRYHHNLQNGISQFNDGPLPAANLDASQLALVDKIQFEDWLAVKVMVSRIEMQCHDELRALQTRLDTLIQAPPGRSFNPFACAFLCQSFQLALNPVKPPASIEKLFYKAFDETVMAGLQDLYQELNQTLIEHQVMPELPSLAPAELPAAIAPVEAAVVTAPLASTARTPGAPVIRTATELYAALGRPLPEVEATQQLTWRPLAPTVGQLWLRLSGGNRKEAVNALTPLECDALIADMSGFADTRNWRERLLEAASERVRPLPQKVLATSYVVDALFDAAQRHAQLSEAADHELRDLSGPLLRLLLSDENQLVLEHSPVRKVMNAIITLCGEVDQLKPEDQDVLSASIDRLASARSPGVAHFSAELPKLTELQSRIELAYRMNLDRLVRHAAGERRLLHARQRVQESLDARLAGHSVPKALLSLLDAGWQELLVLTKVRQGEDSAVWREHWAVLDELLKVARNADYRADWRQLLGAIRAGLETVTGPHSQVQQGALGELKQFATHAIDPSRAPAPAMVSVPQKRPEVVDEAEIRWLEKWLERARRLNRGDLVEIRHKGAEHERLSLAWVADDHSSYVFADHRGQQLQDFTQKELAALLRNGHALVLHRQNLPPFDAAIESVVRELHEQIMFRATHDSLTGLVSRQEFSRIADAAVHRAKCTRARHVLALIAVDQYQVIMQGMGKAEGNSLLREIVHVLAKPLKVGSTLGRLRDDGFALLLEDCELSEAQQLLSLRLGELASARLSVGDQVYQVSASAGLCDISYTSESFSSLLTAADAACTTARDRGGRRMEVHRPDDAELVRRDDAIALVARLNQALEQERLQLRCQQIRAVDFAKAKSEPTNYEILLGMRDVGGEQLPPDVFVQAAERYNRMQAVDRWVIDHSFRWVADHAEKAARLGVIAINLSGHSLNDMHLLEYIFERFAYWKVDPQKFCFEISETTAIAHLADAADLVAELKKCGCRFGLDDFGMGHLPSQYLKHLPVDYVKIDGSFVRELSRSGQDDLVVRSINGLAHVMGRRTIAEFVENDDILRRLAEIGVDYAQGYGIERPRWLASL